MDTHRLKNIIILILLLVNGCLLGALGIRTVSHYNASRQAAEQLVALFAQDGIALEENQIPSQIPPTSRTLQRTTELDASLAKSLLGNDLTVSDMGGGIYTYSNASGSAQFRSNGSFDVIWDNQDGHTTSERWCRTFCSQYGYRDIVSTVTDGTGTVTAVQWFDEWPVINCTVTFTLQDGVLLSASGAHIPDTYIAQGNDTMLNAMTALSIFLAERRNTGAVMSVVNGISLCYQLESSAAAPMTLEPAWRISVDTAVYYVNCITGAVTHE